MWLLTVFLVASATASSNAFSINYNKYSDFAAPVCSDAGPGRFPHDVHCNKYYECDGNSDHPEELDCPTGLHYSEVLETCVLPDYANCNVSRNSAKGL